MRKTSRKLVLLESIQHVRQLLQSPNTQHDHLHPEKLSKMRSESIYLFPYYKLEHRSSTSEQIRSVKNVWCEVYQILVML